MLYATVLSEGVEGMVGEVLPQLVAVVAVVLVVLGFIVGVNFAVKWALARFGGSVYGSDDEAKERWYDEQKWR